jgi:lactate dehydrogenase-like 2-hydroxyacid dehydrogenase
MKVFVTRPIPEEGLKMLRDKGYEVVVNEEARDRVATKEEVLVGVVDADALLSILTEKIDAEIMDAGKNLKIIANYAVGFDNVDLDAAKERNLMVTNTAVPEVSESVAEHTFALMLAIGHRIVEGDQYSRDGKYKAWGPELLMGTDVYKKTLGIVGLGRIGTKIAYQGVRGFDMKVAYNDLKPNPDFEKEFNATYYEKLEDMLPQCDFVSLHVPLLDATKHLMNAERFKLMKNTAFLVNTSRGPVVDEKALVEALKNGEIRGAGIDVFEFEPEISPELKEMDNAIVTPHIASATDATRGAMSMAAATNIIEALEGRTPPNLVK